MNNQSIFVFLISFISFSASAQMMTLTDALEKKYVSVEAQSSSGHSGTCIKLTLRSLVKKYLTIAIEPGSVLESPDSSYQDILLVDAQQVSLRGAQQLNIPLAGFCCRMSRRGPLDGEKFNWAGKINPKLEKVASFLVQKRLQNSPMAQAAIWSVSDNGDLSPIFDKENRRVSKELITLCAQLTDRQVPWYRSEVKKVEPGPQAHLVQKQILQLHADWEFQLKEGDDLTFAIYDSTGKQLDSFFVNKTYPDGIFTFKFSYKTTTLPHGNYYFRMEGKRSGKLKERSVTI